jgi:hypothetical protein
MHRSIICLASILGAAGLAQAADILVPNDFATIQDAIDAAMPVIVSSCRPEPTQSRSTSSERASRRGTGRGRSDDHRRREPGRIRRHRRLGRDGQRAPADSPSPAASVRRELRGRARCGMLVQNASLRIEDSVFVANAGIQGGGVQAISADVLVRTHASRTTMRSTAAASISSSGRSQPRTASFAQLRKQQRRGPCRLLGDEATITDSVFTENGGNGLAPACTRTTQPSTRRALRCPATARSNSLTTIPGGGIIYYTFGAGAIYTSNTNGRIGQPAA